MAEAGYRAQLPASVVARFVPQQPGVGAAIGEGIAQLGQLGQRIGLQDRQVQEQVSDSEQRIALIEQSRARAAAVADGMGRIAQLGLETQTEIEGLRDRSAPGAGDHAEQAEALYRQKARDFIGSLPRDPEVQQHFAPMVARWEASGIAGERGWARERRVSHLGEQFQTSLDTHASALYSAPSADTLQSLLTDFDSAIALQDVDGTAKSVLRQKVRETLVPAMLDGMLGQGGHEAVRAVLEGGGLDSALGGADAKARWMDRVGAEAVAEQRTAEAAQKEAERAATEKLETIEALLDTDQPVTQGAIETALAGARAAGVPDADLIRFADLGQRATARRSVRGMALPELEATRDGLLERRRAGQASADDLRALEAAEDELGARDVKAGAGLREIAKIDPLAAVRQLAGMSPERAWAAAREAGQQRLAVYRTLTPRGMAYAVEGAALRRERPDDFLPPKPERGTRGASAGGQADADSLFRGMIGPDLTDQLGEGYGEVFETALDLMAGQRREWHEATFKRMVQVAFGATQRSDGIWQGGIGAVRGHRIELPAGATQDEFARAYERLTFANARYADGSPANAADVRARFRPRWVPEQEGYWLIGPDDAPLGNASGGAFLLRPSSMNERKR